jgi:hypothetical protein
MTALQRLSAIIILLGLSVVATVILAVVYAPLYGTLALFGVQAVAIAAFALSVNLFFDLKDEPPPLHITVFRLREPSVIRPQSPATA